MTNGWKITAIIFMVIFLLQLILMVWFISWANESIDKENQCSYNICSEYEAYTFDDFTNVCSCYTDKELLYEEFVR